MATITPVQSFESTWLEEGFKVNPLETDPWYDTLYGTSIAISGDGLVMAIGCYAAHFDGDATIVDSTGRVLVYDYAGGAWTLRASLDRYGELDALLLYFGWDDGSICLDQTGDKLVIGGPGYIIPGNINVGRIYSYAWNTTDYVLQDEIPYVDNTLHNSPENPGNYWDTFEWGRYLTMSADGSKLMVGMPTRYVAGPAYSYDVVGEMYQYDWNGGTTSWDIGPTFRNPINSGADEWGLAPQMSGDGSLLIHINGDDGSLLFLEDSGAGFVDITNTQTVIYQPGRYQGHWLLAIQPDGQAFWSADTALSRPDAYRKFTRSGDTWVEDATLLTPTAGWGPFTSVICAAPDNTTVYVGDTENDSFAGATVREKGRVWKYTGTQSLLSTCYTKGADRGVIDYVCVEYPAPPNIPTPPDTNLPAPPAYDSTPNEPAPFLDCTELEAAYFAATNLSDNPEYVAYVDEQYANGTQLDSSNGSQLCKFI